MSIFKELNPFINYLKQIRKLEDYLVFDMSFPVNWKIQKKYIVEDKFVNYGTQTDGTVLLSFISIYNELEINTTKSNILGIIKYNLEREEKERLLDIKIVELRNMFEKQTLENLKSLKFDFNINKNIIIENEPEGKVDSMVGVVEGTGQGGDIEV
jgi:hypothetical protein